MRTIADCRSSGNDGGGVQIERAANTIDSIDNVGGSEHPADAKRSKAMDLRKGPRHDDVFDIDDTSSTPAS